MINLNDFAVEIAKYEGKKEQVNIAQIKEVLHITLVLLAQRTPEEVDDLLLKYRVLSREFTNDCEGCTGCGPIL